MAEESGAHPALGPILRTCATAEVSVGDAATAFLPDGEVVLFAFEADGIHVRRHASIEDARLLASRDRDA
jgi:hypothetical protein